MTPENNADLLNRAEQAFANRDSRTGMACVLQILNQDFTDDPAWRLLYRVLKPNQPFEVFRMELAKKNFPARAHLLEKAHAHPPQSTPPVIQTAPVPLQTSLSQNIQAGPALERFCRRCGQARPDGMRFCTACGAAFPDAPQEKAAHAHSQDSHYQQGWVAPQAQSSQFLGKTAAEIESWAQGEAPQQEPHPVETVQPAKSAFSLKFALISSASGFLGTSLVVTLIAGSPGVGLAISIAVAIFGFIAGGLLLGKTGRRDKLPQAPIFHVKNSKPASPPPPVEQPAKADGGAGRVAAAWILFVTGFGLAVIGVGAGAVFLAPFGYFLQLVALFLASRLARSPHHRKQGNAIIMIWWVTQGLALCLGGIGILSG